MPSKNSNFTKTNTWFSRLNQLRTRHLPKGSIRNSIATGAFWSLCGAVCSRGFTLAVSVVIARLIGKTGFGLWGLIIITVSMFARFAGFGIAQTVSKHVAELRLVDTQRAGKILSLLTIVSFISITLMAIICLLSSDYLANHLFKQPELALPLRTASLLLFSMVGTQMSYGALAGFEDFRSIALINTVQGSVFFVAGTFFTWFFGILGAVIGMSISYCIAMALSLRAVFRNCRSHNIILSTGHVWEESRVLWHYAIPSLLISIVTAPASMLSQALVANVPGGISGLGGYQASVRWRDIVLFVPMSVRQVTLPILSRLKGVSDIRRFIRALWANIVMNGGVALAGAIPIMILSPWILSLYGHGFRQDWDMMVILVGAGVCQAINDVVTQVITSMEKVWWSFGIHIIWGAILLGGSYLLVPYLGVRGYVWSIVATTIIHMLLNISATIILIKRAISIQHNS